MHKKFEINRTNIKDDYQSGRKVVPNDSKSDLPLYLLHILKKNMHNTFCILQFFRIEELSQLNYSLDVELQKERESRETMQAKLRLHGPARSPQVLPRSSEDRDS